MTDSKTPRHFLTLLDLAPETDHRGRCQHRSRWPDPGAARPR